MINKSTIVYVFSERPDVSLELLSIGRELANKMVSGLASISIGADSRFNAKEQIAHGADKVIIIENPRLESFQAELYTEALWQLVMKQEPEIFLIGATKHGMEVAARLAQRLRVSCASECANIKVENGNLIIERRYYTKFIARQLVKSKPKILTIQPRRFEAPARDDHRNGSLQVLTIEVKEPKTKVKASRKKAKSQIEIEKAEAVVSIGRGLKSKHDLQVVAQLAEILGGVVGASRPLTDDLQWLPDDVKVGLSGHTVKPRLYIACGISGQIEHIVGMRESGVVVAINNDPNALIMQEADYCIVGDLYKVLPALTKTISEMMPK